MAKQKRRHQRGADRLSGDSVIGKGPTDAGDGRPLPPLEWILQLASQPNFELAGAHSMWVETANPYYAWKAIQVCTQEKIPFPDWVQAYLGQCAVRMMSASGPDLRQLLPGIFEFPSRRGPGNLLNPGGDDWRYSSAAVRFAREIGRGAKPKDALESASKRLDVGIEGVDDKRY